MTSAQGAAGSAAAGAYAAFAYRDFRCWIGYRYLTGLGLQLKNVGVGWYVYDVTGSAVALGLAGLATFLPSVVFALVTGHVADTRDRRVIVMLSFGACALAMLGLTLAVIAGGAPLWFVYVCVAAVGLGRAFGNPASQAITPNLVAREHFANAVTWYSSTWQFATVTGPVIGGLLYLLGPTVVFASSTGAFALAVVSVLAIRTSLAPSGAGRGPVSWASLSAGLTFLVSQPVMLGAVALDLVAVLFGGVTALLPIVAKDVLDVGPWGNGVLRASPAVGAILMAFFIARMPVESGAGKKMLIAVAIYGAAIAAFGMSQQLWLSTLLLVLVGASDQMSVVIRHTMVQSETPDEMRGRVAAVNSIFISGSSDLGEFRAGMSAAAFGVGPAIVAGGLATIGFAALWAKLFPALAARDKLVE